MSIFIRIAPIAVLIFIIISGCSKNPANPNNSTDPGGNESLKLEDFAFLEYDEYVVNNHNLKNPYGTWYEPVLNREQSLGEPFTDVNGNGVYDEGEDIFIMSANPSVNQDIDRNSTYTGPNDPWSPGIPFDDIDGDGEYDEDNLDRHSYEPGKPFCDLNLNGKRDSLLKTEFYICYPTLVRYRDSSVIRLVRNQYSFRFNSDSNLTYDIDYSPNGGYTLYDNSFVFKNESFEIHGFIHGSEFIIPVINTGTIKTGTYADTSVIRTPYWFDVLDEYNSLSNEYSFTKSVIPDTSITVNDVSYENALVIKMNDFRFIESGQPSSLNIEFYLSRDYGILGYKFSCTPRINRIETFESYFNLRYEENPGMMIS